MESDEVAVFMGHRIIYFGISSLCTFAHSYCIVFIFGICGKRRSRFIYGMELFFWYWRRSRFIDAQNYLYWYLWQAAKPLHVAYNYLFLFIFGIVASFISVHIRTELFYYIYIWYLWQAAKPLRLWYRIILLLCQTSGEAASSMVADENYFIIGFWAATQSPYRPKYDLFIWFIWAATQSPYRPK